MINTSKLALVAALAIGFASPAFAQALNKGDGTGSVSAFAYQQGGGKPTYEPGPGLVGSSGWTVASQREQIASRSTHTARARVQGLYAYHGLYNYAGAPLAGGWNSNSPASTGGGSTGYNQMVLTH